MKTKNLILGFSAFTIALGSTFASLPTGDLMYVKVYATQADFEDDIVTHISTSVSCEDTMIGARCAVLIPLHSTNSLVLTNKTYKNKDCSLPIFATMFAAPLSPVTPIYALVE